MESLETELSRAKALDVADLADAIESIGFECTRCGACCKAVEGEDGGHDHTATVFPDEVRRLQETGEYDWRDVARPMPFGIEEGPDGPAGETFEWSLGTDACGDCVFYSETAGSGHKDGGGDRDGDGPDGDGFCTVHEDRPLICRTYPFSVVLTSEASEGSSDISDGALGGTSQPMGAAVDREGPVRAHECEGLGREISRAKAEELAEALKERAIRELEEAIDVRDEYAPADVEGVVVHDSEGAKRPDGSRLDATDP